MIQEKLPFVCFEPRNGQFIGFLSLEGLLSSEGDPELVLQKATKLYERCVITMRFLLLQIQGFRSDHKLTPARTIWQLGDAIFELKDGLKGLSLQLDGLYDHLVRDLGVKRKWLEKVIIFRRYLPTEVFIPESLNWGRCEKGTRRVAERLRDGLPLDRQNEA